MGLTPAAILYDANGDPLSVVDGVLAVSNRPPTAPPGTTPVTVAQPEGDLTIAGGTGPNGNPHDTAYTIANGKTFHLQTVAAGGGGDPTENGSRVDVLYYDGAAYHVVTRLYVGSASVFLSFPDSGEARDGTTMVGDGSTKKVVLRRIRLSVAALEVDAEIRGFEE